MRAVWYEKTGPADEVLMLGEQPTPQPAPGEVRIRLAASGVNPADCNRHAGNSPMEAPLVIYAVQLARWGGARVIATVGTHHAEDAGTAGADLLDRRADDLAKRIQEDTRGRGLDHIVEVDLGGNLPLTADIIVSIGS